MVFVRTRPKSFERMIPAVTRVAERPEDAAAGAGAGRGGGAGSVAAPRISSVSSGSFATRRRSTPEQPGEARIAAPRGLGHTPEHDHAALWHVRPGAQRLRGSPLRSGREHLPPRPGSRVERPRGAGDAGAEARRRPGAARE